jgi:hypothetical protein
VFTDGKWKPEVVAHDDQMRTKLNSLEQEAACLSNACLDLMSVSIFERELMSAEGEREDELTALTSEIQGVEDTAPNIQM